METIVEALKNLYVAFGGTASDVATITNIADMINSLATIAGSSIELPAVSNTDNGKVLTVSGGKWTKAAVPTELPAVTASDNGKVLKVADGAWAVGTDLVE